MRAAVLTLVAGAFLLAGSTAARADPVNLITNGGFETGDFTGWDVSIPAADAGNCGVRGTDLPFYVHSGSYGSYFGPVTGACYISQTISTVPGEFYDMSGWLRIWPGPAGTPKNNWFEFWWGGESIIRLENEGNSTWGEGTFRLLATSDQTEVKFGFFNPPGVFAFDDVAVTRTAVAEPATLLLVGTGVAGLLARRRPRRR